MRDVGAIPMCSLAFRDVGTPSGGERSVRSESGHWMDLGNRYESSADSHTSG